jgi:hypothetical protein
MPAVVGLAPAKEEAMKHHRKLLLRIMVTVRVSVKITVRR